MHKLLVGLVGAAIGVVVGAGASYYLSSKKFKKDIQDTRMGLYDLLDAKQKELDELKAKSVDISDKPLSPNAKPVQKVRSKDTKAFKEYKNVTRQYNDIPADEDDYEPVRIEAEEYHTLEGYKQVEYEYYKEDILVDECGNEVKDYPVQVLGEDAYDELLDRANQCVYARDDVKKIVYRVLNYGDSTFR